MFKKRAIAKSNLNMENISERKHSDDEDQDDDV